MKDTPQQCGFKARLRNRAMCRLISRQSLFLLNKKRQGGEKRKKAPNSSFIKSTRRAGTWLLLLLDVLMFCWKAVSVLVSLVVNYSSMANMLVTVC